MPSLATTTSPASSAVTSLDRWGSLPVKILHEIAWLIALFKFNEQYPDGYAEEQRTFVPNVTHAFRAIRCASAMNILAKVNHHWDLAIRQSPHWDTIVRNAFQNPKALEWLRPQVSQESPSHVLYDREAFCTALRTLCLPCLYYSSQVTPALQSAPPLKNWWIGTVYLCKYHHTNGVCGSCIKDEHILMVQYRDNNQRLAQVDEIDDTFGDVDFTCQPCRMRVLRKDLFRMNYTHADLQKTDMMDTFQSYSEFGEGSVADIAATIAERKWFNAFTKIQELSAQYAVAFRMGGGQTIAEANTYDFPTLYNNPDIRRACLEDFVRQRIFEGNWVAPVDAYEYYYHYRGRAPLWVSPQHVNHLDVIEPATSRQERIIGLYQVPYGHAGHDLQILWERLMTDIIKPAVLNVVAEAVDSCLVNGKVWEHEKGERAPGHISDPYVVLPTWSIQDVWQRLMQVEYWVTGFDWRTRKLNEHRARRVSDASFGSSKSSASSHSTGPSASPTGTHSTGHTTPSPPPGSDAKTVTTPSDSHAGGGAESSPRGTTASPPVPIDDLPDIEVTGANTRMPNSIPKVPHCVGIHQQLPARTIEKLWGFWKEGIRGYTKCPCSICRRNCVVEEEVRLKGPLKKRETGITINEPVKKEKAMDVVDEEDEGAGEMDAEAESTPAQGAEHLAIPRTPSPPSNPRKRSSQEVESRPSSPTSAVKKRKLENGEAIDTSAAVSSPPASQADSVQAIMGFEGREDGVGLSVYDFVLDEDVAEDEYEDEFLDDDEEIDDEDYDEYQNQGGWTHNGQSKA